MNHFLQLMIVSALFVMISPTITFGQTKIKFGYDNGGNRKSRNVIIMSSALADSADNTQTEKSAQQKQVFTENLGGQNVLIYPNPTRGQLRVEIQGAGEETTIEIYLFNLSGGLLISRKPAGTSTLLDITAYPIGTYILRVGVGGKTSEWKVVKE